MKEFINSKKFIVKKLFKKFICFLKYNFELKFKKN